MLFCTQQFLIFFLVVFTAYWSLPWQRGRVLLLLAASYYFYSCWNPWLAALIFVTTVLDYTVARLMDASPTEGRRKCLLALSILANVGFLVYFKYANFFLDSLNQALHAAGAGRSFPVLSVILPVGISFYTFEAISYTVDVYQRRIKAEKNLAHFLLFILFFPHLVAGPIVRARDYLPQIRRRKRLTWPRLALGGRLILLGLFKKMAIADRMALLADPVFADSGAYATGVLWLAAMAYAFQVYCDFSGYSDLALGTAHLLGYHLPENFNMPFAAANITDFWRRWHISLSSWIRDYIFIPLGGSRGSEWATCRNLLIGMTLCGLWHGAAWPFVAFGFIQGCMLITHRHFRRWAKEKPGVVSALESVPGTVGRVALTFIAFTVSLAVFRSPTLTDGFTMLAGMFSPRHGLALPLPAVTFWAAAAVLLVGHLLGQWPDWWRSWERLPPPVRGFGYAGMLAATLLLAPVTTQTFIYFQF